MAGIKKLTQAQRAYFIKRIDEITAQKMSEVRKTRVTVSQIKDNYQCNYAVPQNRSVPDKTLDRASLAGVVSGKIKILAKKDVIAHIKDRLNDGNFTTYANISANGFVDQDSLAKFNRARSAKAKEEKEKMDTRMGTIRNTASELKDKVMLEGNLAIGMLEDFEKEKF